ncbi:MAG: hypothetical protein ACI9EF_000641 [Pseudohongiellaceae bacterium]|jgi:hypothetical protein
MGRAVTLVIFLRNSCTAWWFQEVDFPGDSSGRPAHLLVKALMNTLLPCSKRLAPKWIATVVRLLVLTHALGASLWAQAVSDPLSPSELVETGAVERPVRLVGRLVDHLGLPVAGGRLGLVAVSPGFAVHWPSAGASQSLPLPRVSVSEGPWIEVGDSLIAESDEDGRFHWVGRLTALQGHSGESHDQVAGWALVWYSAGMALRTERFLWGLEELHSMGDLRLEPAVTLKGKVAFGNGLSPESVHVLVDREYCGWDELEGAHRAAWRMVRFELKLSDEGEFVSDVIQAGYAPHLNLMAPGRLKYRRALDDVLAGATMDVGEAELFPAWTLSGHVIDELGAPISGAHVLADDMLTWVKNPTSIRGMVSGLEHLRLEAPFTIATTGEHGEFSVSGIREGECRLLVEAVGYSPEQRERVTKKQVGLEIVLSRSLPSDESEAPPGKGH